MPVLAKFYALNMHHMALPHAVLYVNDVQNWAWFSVLAFFCVGIPTLKLFQCFETSEQYTFLHESTPCLGAFTPQSSIPTSLSF